MQSGLRYIQSGVSGWADDSWDWDSGCREHLSLNTYCGSSNCQTFKNVTSFVSSWINKCYINFDVGCTNVYVIIYQMWCCQYVSSQLHTHCWNVSWCHSQSLRVNAFELWHARGPSGLAKDLVCAPILQAYVVRMFSVCGLLCSGWRSAVFRSVEMRVCLKLNQRMVKETSCPQ